MWLSCDLLTWYSIYRVRVSDHFGIQYVTTASTNSEKNSIEHKKAFSTLLLSSTVLFENKHVCTHTKRFTSDIWETAILHEAFF